MSSVVVRMYSRLITRQLARSFSQQASRETNKKAVAVVLSGCGVYDGTEIHEASACLVHLSRHDNVKVDMFAPDKPQMHTIDHTKGEPVEGETRNVLVESARIARGKISSLVDLTAQEYDAIVIPGGFGAAKNLSNFATGAGAKMVVDDEVEKVVKEFAAAKKPMGFCCISPVIAAKLIGGVVLTVGCDQEMEGRWPYYGTAGAIEEMGATHVNREVTEIHVDEANKVVSVPAFMCNAPLHEVYDGIGHMINTVVKMTD